jgi:hypothetical protein
LDSAFYKDSGHSKPTAEIVKIINENLLEKLVSATKVSGHVRTYATYSPTTGELSIFLMNKEESSSIHTISLSNYTAPQGYERYVFKGTSCKDLNPTYGRSGSISFLSGNEFSTTLDPCSVTVVKFNPKLRGWWKFDETSGTVSDSSGNGYDGTLINGASRWNAGKFGRTLYLDGIDDFVSLPNILDPSATNFTASTWVKLDLDSSFGTRQVILQQEGGGSQWLFRESLTGKLGTYVGSALLSTGTILPGNWTHVAVVRSGTTIALYINGIKDSTATGTPVPSTSPMRIGQHKTPETTNEEWQGMIDDLRIYDKALSDNEILSLYLEGNSEPPHRTAFISEYFDDMAINQAPTGWTVSNLGGSATVQGMLFKNNAGDMENSAFNKAIKLSDTSASESGQVEVKKEFTTPQIGKIEAYTRVLNNSAISENGI